MNNMFSDFREICITYSIYIFYTCFADFKTVGMFAFSIRSKEILNLVIFIFG